jgi:hypothetical protein
MYSNSVSVCAWWESWRVANIGVYVIMTWTLLEITNAFCYNRLFFLLLGGKENVVILSFVLY